MPRTNLAFLLVLTLCCLTSACSPRSFPAPQEATPSRPSLPPRQQPSQAIHATSQPTLEMPMTPVTPNPNISKPLTLGEVTTLVVADLAAYLNVEASAIEILQAQERIWMEGVLGCNVRKGLVEPTPIPGYWIVLRYQQTSYEYHADRTGNFVRCPAVDKPLGPIR